MAKVWVVLALGLSVAIAGLTAGHAVAMISSPLAVKTPATQSSPVHKAACLGFGGCGLGFHRACNRWRCWCAPCL
jgi:hypothetical protein